MGSSLDGVLTIDEGVVFLAILVGVGKGYLDILALQVDDGIKAIVGHAIGKQILQTIARDNAATIIHDGQTRVQVGIVAEHVLDDLVAIRIVLKQRVVGLEHDIGARLVIRGLSNVALEDTTLEDHLAYLSVTIAMGFEMGTQEVDSLDTDTIHSHRLLKGLGVVLTTRIQLADGFDDLSLRDTTTIVANRDPQMVYNIDLNALASIHTELIDGVVDGFFQKYVDTILWLRTVGEASDVHARTRADMVYIRQVADVVFIVVYLFIRLTDYAVVFYHKAFL